MEKKRLWKLLLTAVFVVAMLTVAAFVLVLPVGAEEELTDSYYTYSVTDGEAKITGVDTSVSGDVIIPETLGGYPVTSIGERAFEACSSLTGIAIPNSVVTISDGAFFNCSNITNMTIGSGVESIGNFTFAGCTNLEAITIPESLKSIYGYAFSGCSSLESITVDANNEFYHSVDNCLIETKSGVLVAGFANSVIPTDGSVTSIGEAAFYWSQSLERITIPGSVTNIGMGAFYCCSNLTSIIIPNSVTKIGNRVFNACSNLETIYFCGSEEEWNAIEKDISWDLSAGSNTANGTYTVVFNHALPEESTPEESTPEESTPEESKPEESTTIEETQSVSEQETEEKTEKPTEKATEPVTESNNKEKETNSKDNSSGGYRSSGCGSSVGGGAVAIISAFALCGAMMRRKKED